MCYCQLDTVVIALASQAWISPARVYFGSFDACLSPAKSYKFYDNASSPSGIQLAHIMRSIIFSVFLFCNLYFTNCSQLLCQLNTDSIKDTKAYHIIEVTVSHLDATGGRMFFSFYSSALSTLIHTHQSLSHLLRWAWTKIVSHVKEPMSTVW